MFVLFNMDGPVSYNSIYNNMGFQSSMWPRTIPSVSWSSGNGCWVTVPNNKSDLGLDVKYKFGKKRSKKLKKRKSKKKRKKRISKRKSRRRKSKSRSKKR
jgi:hypothetical protein